MIKNYVYRIDHDKGFAPNVSHGMCSVCGCLQTIERNAQPESLVIGLGGNNSGKSNKIIYAMLVDKCLPYWEFCKQYPVKSKYLAGHDISKYDRVLFSKRFYYFGDNAFDLPNRLQHIVYKGRNCKCISDSDKSALVDFLAAKYSSYGVYGMPNYMNAKDQCSNKC